jgi:beta-glucosidase
VLSWSGTRDGMVRISGRAADMRAESSAGTAIHVRYRVEHAPESTVTVGMRCTQPLCATEHGAMLDLTAAFQSAKPGEWETLDIPLSCVSATGADLASVEVPFTVETSGKFALSIAQVRLASDARAAKVPCPQPASRSGS